MPEAPQIALRRRVVLVRHIAYVPQIAESTVKTLVPQIAMALARTPRRTTALYMADRTIVLISVEPNLFFKFATLVLPTSRH